MFILPEVTASTKKVRLSVRCCTQLCFATFGTQLCFTTCGEAELCCIWASE
jgi:hypothetical protein